MMLTFHAHDDALGIDRVHDAVAPCQNHSAGIAGRNAFHTGADNRRRGAKQRYRLALHVGAHQRAVRVVVLQEWHQRGRDRHQLFGADVDVVDFFVRDQHKVAGLAGVDEFRRDAALVVEFDVGLRDYVPVFLPGRQIKRERLEIDRFLAALFQIGVGLFRFFKLDVVAHPVVAVAGVDHGDKVDNARLANTTVWRLDETIVVDAGVAAQRADQADVRAFRSLNGAYTAVVGRMHVADFEPGAFAGKTAWPQRGETPLVRDLRERVGLVHELRKLRRSEELADRSHHRLGIDQVVRHSRGHLLVHAHLFLDSAFHADQANAELVLHELAHRADAAVAQMIDIVHRSHALAQLQQIADGGIEIIGIERPLFETGGVVPLVQLDVELQAAHAAEVVLAGIEEHAMEQGGGRVQSRRIARAQLAVDLNESFLGRLDGVAAKRGADYVAYIVAFREEDVNFLHARVHDLRELVGGELAVGLEQHFARRGVDDVGGGECAFEIGGIDIDLGNPGFLDFLQNRP